MYFYFLRFCHHIDVNKGEWDGRCTKMICNTKCKKFFGCCGCRRRSHSPCVTFYGTAKDDYDCVGRCERVARFCVYTKRIWIDWACDMTPGYVMCAFQIEIIVISTTTITMITMATITTMKNTQSARIRKSWMNIRFHASPIFFSAQFVRKLLIYH